MTTSARPDPHLAAASHPDAHAVRRLIARDLATLDPFRRRRYRARLARLIAEAEARRSAADEARLMRSAAAFLTAGAAAATSAALIAATVSVDASPLLRLALAAAATCAALVSVDALSRRSPTARREDSLASPENAALGLHLEAFAALSYAADLPPAPERRRERQLIRR